MVNIIEKDHVLCDEHFTNSTNCTPVSPEDVLQRLRHAKNISQDPLLLIVDVREPRFYRTSHILTAISMSCHTRTMARRAVVSWDINHLDQDRCFACRWSEDRLLDAKLLVLNANSVVVYNQSGTCPFCDERSSSNYFLDALMARGNRVYFMIGGFEAFQQLHSADFIDRDSSVSAEHSASICDNHLRLPVLMSPPGLAPLNYLPDVERKLPGLSIKSDTHSTKIDCQSDPPTKAVPYTSILTTPHSAVWNLSDMSAANDPDDVLNATISQILPFLYIGNARDAQDLDLLSRLGITHIVNVSDSVPMPFIDSVRFHYLHLPALDNSGQNLKPAFESAVKFIHEARVSNGIVLVHCRAGVSRSVAVVVAFIMHQWRNFNVIHALDFVQTRRPVAGPNLHFMGQLQRYHDELHGSLNA